MRLFVAVDLGDAIGAGIAEQLRKLPPRAPQSRWTPAASMHLTLVFLGEIEDERVPSITAAIQSVAARHTAFDLKVEGGGTFGPKSRPRVLWLGIGGDLPELTALQAELANALIPLGYVPEDRAFSPHLTLARAGARGGDAALLDCAAELRDIRIGSARIDEIILYRSELSRAGARYTAVGSGRLDRKP